MGHKDIQTTMDIYAEVTDGKKQNVFENLAKEVAVFQESAMSIASVPIS